MSRLVTDGIDSLPEYPGAGAYLGRPAGTPKPKSLVRNDTGKMSRTIQCSNCGVVLNLPPQVQGRRLKCPKCGTKFEFSSASSSPAASPKVEPSPSSTLLLTKKPSSGELPVMPTSAGDLRETFDLPMMRDEAAPAVKMAPIADVADANALFKDDGQVTTRRKNAAEARSKARRCPTCGSVVQVGMSLCNTCGLDLETGIRVGLTDDLSPPPLPSSGGMPIPVAVIGGLSFAGSVVAALVAIVAWLGGTDGAQYFVPVALFGAYAAVQFLRGKTLKLLLVALGLAAAIDLAALVALPIYQAQAETNVVQVKDVGDDPDATGEVIRPMAERLDTQRITTGFVLLVLYAAISVYLLSPQVNRHFRK